MLLPWSASLDVSWAGIYNYNTVEYGTVGTPTGQLPMDMNAPDLGTSYLAKNQDPTLGTSTVPGATSLTTNLLRPYRGLGSITASWPYAYNRYDSIQYHVQPAIPEWRNIGGNYTLGLRNVGNMFSPPHFEHQPDGTLKFASVQDKLDSILHDNGTRRHVLKIFGVYQAPNLHVGGKVLSALASAWQVSGSFQAGTGPAYDATYTYNSAGPNVNITGSPSYAGRIKVVGDPGSGCSGNQYKEFNTAAFSDRATTASATSRGRTSCAGVSTIRRICRSAAISRSGRSGGDCKFAPMPTTSSTMW